MIKTENLVKNFEDFTALDHVNMHVPAGAVYGLVGPNGAGKTTILRHVAGIYKPEEGQVLIGDRPVYENPQVKASFTYIPDDFFYFSQANTLEMMKFYKNIYPHFDEKLFEELREAFREIDPKKKVARLSKGMQKQVAFWLSICCRPEIMLLDEPVDGLDPVMRRQVWSVILSGAVEHGTTVLVSSHNLRELEDVCDHVGIMHRGKLVLEHSLSELQGNISKVQIAFAPGAEPSFEDLPVHTAIIKGNPLEVEDRLKKINPLLLDILPLSLEEIFIYELGGDDYAVKEILI